MNAWLAAGPEVPVSSAGALQRPTIGKGTSGAVGSGTHGKRARLNTAVDVAGAGWIAPGANQPELERIGFKLCGGGAHQSKTMMLGDLAAVMALEESAVRSAVLDENALGKPSGRARAAAWRRLCELYGVGGHDPLWAALRELWGRDGEGRQLLALLCALARDPTLRAGASAVLDASVGERVGPETLAAAFEAAHPLRLSPGTAASLSRNASSSWLQAGFLAGPVRKRRVRAKATPYAAAFAALLAGLCGFGGVRLLASRWLDVLDCPTEERLSLLRQAEGLGLARVRSAGDVLEIETLRPMAETLGIPALVDR